MGTDEQQLREFIAAYMECSDQIQIGIREMLDIAINPKASKQERDMAINTIVEALQGTQPKGE